MPMPGGDVRSARSSAPSTDSTRSESGRRSHARTAPVLHGSPGQVTVNRSVDHRQGEERASAAEESADGVGTRAVWSDRPAAVDRLVDMPRCRPVDAP